MSNNVPEKLTTDKRNGLENGPDLHNLTREDMAGLALDRLGVIVAAMPRMRPRQQQAVVTALAYALSDLAGAGVTL